MSLRGCRPGIGLAAPTSPAGRVWRVAAAVRRADGGVSAVEMPPEGRGEQVEQLLGLAGGLGQRRMDLSCQRGEVSLHRHGACGCRCLLSGLILVVVVVVVVVAVVVLLPAHRDALTVNASANANFSSFLYPLARLYRRLPLLRPRPSTSSS